MEKVSGFCQYCCFVLHFLCIFAEFIIPPDTNGTELSKCHLDLNFSNITLILFHILQYITYTIIILYNILYTIILLQQHRA